VNDLLIVFWTYNYDIKSNILSQTFVSQRRWTLISNSSANARISTKRILNISIFIKSLYLMEIFLVLCEILSVFQVLFLWGDISQR
jgi:hypothetical protein